MKRTALWLFLPFAMFTFATAGYTQGAPTDEQARRLAMDTVANATKITLHELNTRRREDLEDTLFSFQRKVAGRIQKGAYFYEVVNGGYQITLDQVTYSKPTQRWLVAVSTHEGTTFGLEGFADGEAAFGRLLSKAVVEVRNAAQAKCLRGSIWTQCTGMWTTWFMTPFD